MKIRRWAGIGVLALALSVPLAGCTTSQPTESTESATQSAEEAVQSEDVAQSESEMQESEEITAQTLEGTWQLTAASGPNGLVSGLPAGSLVIEDGLGFSFSAECNQFAGTMTVEDGSVEAVLGTDCVVQTLMLCEGSVGEVDDIASAVFSQIQSATLTQSGELTLVGPDGQSLVFERA